jgi:hypothetical protein
VGQDISGTQLATTAMASERRVAFRLLCDWAEAGFGSEGSWTDESQYVTRVSGTLEGSDYLNGIGAVGGGVAGVCNVTLRNPDLGAQGFRFSPSNASGPLYSSIADSAWFLKRAVVEMGFYSGATPERLRQMTGYIVGWREDYARRQVTLEIRDRAAGAALARAATGIYVDTRAGDYMAALCALLGRDPVEVGDQKLDDGVMLSPFQWADDETVWEEMGLLAEAQVGRVWFDKDGDLHFDDGAHWVKPQTNAWDDPATSQATLTVDDFLACSPHYNPDNVYNDVIVEYQPRYIGVEQVVYSTSETQVVPPSGSITFDAEYRYPVYSTETPRKDDDFTAVSAGGTNLNDDMTVTVGSGAGKATITIENGNADYAAYVVRLDIRGRPMLSKEASKYQAEDAATLTRFRRTRTVQNPYVQAARHAEMIGDFALARYKDAIQELSLKNVRGIPWLEPGDRVTVAESKTGVNAAFFVGRMQWSWAPGAIYAMSLDLMRVSDIFASEDYFVIGTDKYGSGTGHSHLFW